MDSAASLPVSHQDLQAAVRDGLVLAGFGVYVLLLAGLGFWMAGNRTLMRSFGKLGRDTGRGDFFQKLTPEQIERRYQFTTETLPKTMRIIVFAILLPLGAYLLLQGVTEAALAGWQLLKS